MFSSLSQLFGGQSAEAESQSDEQHRLRVATCVLLLEAAHADADFTAEEETGIRDAVSRRFDLDGAETDGLLTEAEAARQSSGDLYSFGRLVNNAYSRPRKLAVIELLWEVVYSDGILDAHEDALMHKIGRLLGLRNDELMAVKVQVSRRLGAD